MDSNSSEWHSENEFYYPDEIDENVNTGNTDKQEQAKEKTGKEQQFLAEVHDFIEEQRPENTKKKTLYDINIWKRYLSSAGEERNIEDIPAKDLNLHMCRFFMEIKKKDGEQYEPTTLTSFQRSLQRYLNDHGSTLNIVKDQQFSLSRDALSKKKRAVIARFWQGKSPTSRSSLDRCRGRLDV